MKKVLIITYYWPPSAGSGVQRWVKFAKYLPQFGWEPIIFTPENPDFQVKDNTLLNDVSPEMEVIKFPIWEPYQLQRTLWGKNKDFNLAESLEKKKKNFLDHVSIWARGNILIPDPRVFWVRPSVRFLLDIINTNHIDVIITTGPPHSLHLIGLKLKEKTGIKWVADFRDPWSKWELLDTLYLTSFAKRRHRKLEDRVLKTADSIVTISETFKRDFESLGVKKSEVITNGFDLEDFKEATSIDRADKFVISHVGTIDDLRDPRPFLNAAKALITEDKHLAKALEIQFIGRISKKLITEIEGDAILNQIVIFKPYVPHKEVFKLYKQSSVLLLVLANSSNAEGNVPGKLFEYLAAERPILALGKTNGDSSKIVSDANAGKTCDPQNIEAIKEGIKKFYDAYKAEDAQDIKDVYKYSRENLTKKLAQLLDKLKSS